MTLSEVLWKCGLVTLFKICLRLRPSAYLSINLRKNWIISRIPRGISKIILVQGSYESLAWRLRWCDRELESVNLCSHMLHLKGFSPVWTLRRCSASLCASKKPLPHHWHACGRSFECRDFWWRISLFRVIKAFWHSPQWNAAIPVWSAMWYLRPRGVLKPRGH